MLSPSVDLNGLGSEGTIILYYCCMISYYRYYTTVWPKKARDAAGGQSTQRHYSGADRLTTTPSIQAYQNKTPYPTSDIGLSLLPVGVRAGILYSWNTPSDPCQTCNHQSPQTQASYNMKLTCARCSTRLPPPTSKQPQPRPPESEFLWRRLPFPCSAEPCDRARGSSERERPPNLCNPSLVYFVRLCNTCETPQYPIIDNNQ